MENEKKPLGIIDALSNGFILVVQRPWILLIPLLLDFFLWLEPPINAKPVFDQILALTNEPQAQAQMTPDMQPMFESMQNTIRTAGEKFDVLVVAAWSAVGVPSLEGSDLIPIDDSRMPWLVIDNSLVLVLWLIVLALVGAFISSVYLEIMARGIRRDTSPLTSLVPRVFRSFLNLVGLALVLLVLFFAILMPVAVLAAFLTMVSQWLASFVIILMTFVIVWAGLYLAFALPAIFVSGSNPMQAILNSVMVFRVSVGSAVGLVFLTYLIQMGFSIIWQQLLSGPGGIVFNVIANAFIGSGLTAALMLFYQDRLLWIVQMRARLIQQRPVAKG